MSKDDWSWVCHICNQRRPDKFISVYSSVKLIQRMSFTQNVRYCNDNADCAEKAKGFSFFKTKQGRCIKWRLI